MTNVSAPVRPPIRPADRLSLTLFLATVVHALVIFGVSFTAAGLNQPSQPPPLDVVMVQSASREAPQDSERIAQADQQASGRSEQENNPTSPLSGPSPQPAPGAAPFALDAAPARQQPSEQEQVLTQETAPEQTPNPQREKADPVETTQPADTQAREQRNLQIAQLAAELDQEERRYAERPRIQYLDTLSAKSAVEASYIEDWVNKVERVGNLNYPGAARRRNLSGSLILNVLIDRDGRVLDIEVAAPSGEQVLDDAARRIVETAAPYTRFPADMREEYDQLMITRTWIFQHNNRLTTE